MTHASATDSSGSRRRPELFVVDGSNIATEGRTVPSLEQLNDAVLAFLDAHPGAVVTVVVDATFGHRIDKSEAKAFDEAVANNELVTPPAGAVGRGDAFVLAIADRAGAGILSNDSFQEFHGEYDWLFDDGRLIGGKPVPHVGWVFVKRSPVRGPKSRQAMREASGDVGSSKERANRRVRKKASPAGDVAGDEGQTGSGVEPARVEVVERAVEQASTGSTAPAKGPVNELMPFLEFVQRHPVGTSCSAVVESYSSHGAYARAGDVLVYVPLRLMADPPPRSARSALALGEAITIVIVRYVPDRRSIDAALPNMAESGITTSVDTDAEAGGVEGGASDDHVSTKRAPARKRSAKKRDASPEQSPLPETVATEMPAKKTTATKKSANKTTANKTRAKSTVAENAPAAKESATKKSAVTTKTTATKTTATKTTATKTTKTTAAKTTAATAAKTTAAKKSAANKTTAKSTVADKAPATKKSAAKKSAAKKSVAKKSAAKKVGS
ncbi:MAG: hypothetical protein RLZZ01_712 [Actinomycetota bacterium]